MGRNGRASENKRSVVDSTVGIMAIPALAKDLGTKYADFLSSHAVHVQFGGHGETGSDEPGSLRELGVTEVG